MEPSGAGAGSERARRAAELVARVGILAVALVQAGKRLADPDLPFHLALGRVIAETRAIPRTDPLSFTHYPVQYIEFVSDAALWAVFRAGGELGLQLLGALAFVAVVLLLLVRCRGSGPMAFAVVAVAVAAIGDWILVRPATFSFVLFGVLLLLCDTHARAPASRAGRGSLYALVPLFALWVNVHGFSVLGLGVLGIYATHRVLCRLTRGRVPGLLPTEDAADWDRAALVALLSFLVAGLNVAGFRLLTAPLRLAPDLGRIGEWQPPSLGFLLERELGVVAFVLVLGLALALGKNETGGRSLRLRELLLVVLAAYVGSRALRMVPVAVILVAPLAARRLSPLTAVTPLLQVASAVLLVLAAPVVYVQNPTSFGVGFEPAHFPEGAVRFVQAAKPSGRMWNYLDFGGYLALRLYPEHLVFIDGRTSWVYDQKHVDRFHASLRDPQAFRGLVQELHLTWAVARAKSPEPLGAPLAMSPDWTMVYLDGISAVYVRNQGENAGLAQRGYRVLRHTTPPPVALSAALGGQIAAGDLGHDAELAVTQAPRDARAWFFEAAAGVALRDAARLNRARAKLDELAPGHPVLSFFDLSAKSTGLR